MYNMEVEDTHNFIIQGGVVAHNCADEWRYVMMGRPIKAHLPGKAAPLTDDPLNQRVPKRQHLFISHGYQGR